MSQTPAFEQLPETNDPDQDYVQDDKTAWLGHGRRPALDQKSISIFGELLASTANLFRLNLGRRSCARWLKKSGYVADSVG